MPPFERRTITSREEWLEWRKADITGSAAAALVGAHDYLSLLQLYLDKAGIAPANDVDTPPMRRGRLLESVALEVIREMHPDWNVRPAGEYLRDPVYRLGATPDFYAELRVVPSSRRRRSSRACSSGPGSPAMA